MVARARAAGVRSMLTVGTDAASSARAAALAAWLPGVSAAVGLHPMAVREERLERELAAVETLLTEQHGVVRAVGEIGLDLAGAAAAPIQERAFAAQLELATWARLPVVLHSVGAHERAAEMLAPVRPALPAVIVHYFAGDAAEAWCFLDLDCHISFGRLLLKPGQDALREAARQVPAGRLLVETDTYPLPGRTTEPRDVIAVVEALAALRGQPVGTLAAQMMTNYRRVLGEG